MNLLSKFCKAGRGLLLSFVLLGLVWTFYTRLDGTVWSEITLDHPEKPLTKKELEDFIEESGKLSKKDSENVSCHSEEKQEIYSHLRNIS